jgi:ubiquinone/menaquinone biosynthesis C-methylase UbiE
MQYATDANLKIRQETHAQYTVGQPLEPWLDAHLALEPNAALLDVGTADGAFPIRLRQTGHLGRLVGIDLSSGMIASAKDHPSKVEFFVADAMSVPFPDQSFDVVTARHMLYHVPDIQKALLEIRRVLKPIGKFFALTNTDGYMAEYWAAILETLREMHEFAEFIAEHHSPKFFHTDLERQIQNVFGKTELHIKSQYFEFQTAVAPLAYWHSMQAGKGISPTAWQTASQKLEVAFSQKTQTPWRIQKDVALFKATR